MNNKMFANTQRRAWLVPIALAPLLALAGCGGVATKPASASPSSAPAGSASSAPAAAAQSSSTDVCALVTEEEATAALGSDPGAGTKQGTGANQACMFGGNGLFLQVGVNPNQTRELLNNARATIQSSFGQQGGAVIEVAGMGDANFVASSPHGGGCYVLKGSVLGHITLINPTAMTSAGDIMTTLCRAMAGRF